MRPLLLTSSVRVVRPIVVFAAMVGPSSVAADPVQELAALLAKEIDLEDRAALPRQKEQLQKRAESLTRPSELRAALLLPGWKRGPSEDQAGEEDPLGKVYREVWDQLAARLAKALRADLGAEEVDRRLAAVTFLAEMADDQRKAEEGLLPTRGWRRGWPVIPFTARMTGDLRKVLDKDKDAEVCATAVRALVETDPGAAATLDALKPLLGPGRKDVERRAAAQGLERMFLLLVEFPHVAAREGVLPQRRLSPLDQAGPRIVAAAGPGLRDKDATVRRLCLSPIRQAARQISSYSREIPRPLVVAVKEQTPAVAGLLADSDRAVRLSALQVLEDIAVGRRHLHGSAPERPAEERALLDGALKALPGLTKSLSDDDVRVRLASLYVLETLEDGAAPAVEAVAVALKDKNGFVRWGAARVLNNLAPHESDKAVPALAAVLTDANQTVRLTAVAALQRYGPKAAAAVDELGKAAITDTEMRMRLGAVNALAAIGAKARPEADRLVRAAMDPAAEVRAAAAKALGQLGRLDRDAVRALRKALRDSDAAVRQAASATLLDDR